VQETRLAASSAGRTPALHDPLLYTNRELSWLEFNQRVLDQAIADHHPLLERVKFLAIVGSNLDEFFMVRVATLRKRQRAGLEQVSPDGLTVSQQLAAIRDRAVQMMRDQASCWQDLLRPALAEAGVTFLDEDQYTDRVRRHLATYFKSDVFPLLTPLAFDPDHPFPHISNRSKNLAVAIQHNRRTKFARVKIPDILPRFVPVPSSDGPTFAFSGGRHPPEPAGPVSRRRCAQRTPLPDHPRHRHGSAGRRRQRPAGIGRSKPEEVTRGAA
jgi:polyphosphate kinase